MCDGGIVMYYQQDWIMRQIQALIKFIGNILNIEKQFQCSENEYDKENEMLKSKTKNLIENYQFNEAELIILEAIHNNSKQIGICLWFYEYVNLCSDFQLEQGGFSRENILTGMKNLCLECKIIDYNTLEYLINTEE